MMDGLLSTVVDEPIEPAEAIEFVQDPACGAAATFYGMIRNTNKGQTVIKLFYEVYEAMYHNVNQQLFAEAQEQWDVRRMAIVQRTGDLAVGESGIVIAVSSPHRRDALQAVEYCIEEFKKRSPVWKKETTVEGDEWINWPAEHQSR